MPTKRKPLKPVKGWVVVGPDGDMIDRLASPSSRTAWDNFIGYRSIGERNRWKHRGYRAVPVVVMERGKK